MLTRRDFLARLQAAGLTFTLAGQLTGQGYVSSGQSSCKHSVRSGIISDQLGEGQQVTINSSNPDNSIYFILPLSLYKNHHAVFIEAVCYNRYS